MNKLFLYLRSNLLSEPQLDRIRACGYEPIGIDSMDSVKVLDALNSTSNGSIRNIKTEMIQSVIDSLPFHFTTTDVILGLGDRGKELRPSVKVLLSRLTKEGSIAIERKGSGRRASVFTKLPIKRNLTGP